MELITDEQALKNIYKPRDPYTAFILTLLTPGLGQLYNGQPGKAVLFFAFAFAFPFIFVLTHALYSFYGLLIMVLVVIAFAIVMLIDAVKNANRQKEYIKKKYNRWGYYLLIIIVPGSIGQTINSNFFQPAYIGAAQATNYPTNYYISALGIQTLKISTTSNNPTFQVGDYLVEDSRAYKNSEPDYGDMVVFKKDDGELYISRVVGRPNDTLDINDDIVTINGKSCKATFIKETSFEEIRAPYEKIIGMLKGNMVSIKEPRVAQISVNEFEEELPDGHKHLIYKFKQANDSTKATIKNIVVSANSYYLLGDNRDNSKDSRYEGAVSMERIQGRILFSYWGQSTDRINIDFRDK